MSTPLNMRRPPPSPVENVSGVELQLSPCYARFNSLGDRQTERGQANGQTGHTDPGRRPVVNKVGGGGGGGALITGGYKWT
jgi:hypothetical protein